MNKTLKYIINDLNINNNSVKNGRNTVNLKNVKRQAALQNALFIYSNNDTNMITKNK